MANIVKIAGISMATWDDLRPPYNERKSDPEENLRLGVRLLNIAGLHGVDLACLPETFMAAGLPFSDERSAAVAIGDPAVKQISKIARKYSMYVVAGFLVEEGNSLSNQALLFDRKGEIVGKYAKVHPIEAEINSGVQPGDGIPVFETDFGKLGIAICFDLNWPSQWESFAKQGVDLVCWISAYDGGFPLQAYAFLYQYPIVTSVWTYHARIVDISGQILSSSSRWDHIAFSTVDLEKCLFHTDFHMDKIMNLQEEYRSRLKIHAMSEENLFTIESQDENLSVKDVIRKHDLVILKEYISRCEQAQDRSRVG